MAFLTRFLAVLCCLAVASARTGFIKNAAVVRAESVENEDVPQYWGCPYPHKITNFTLTADVLTEGKPAVVTSMFRMFSCTYPCSYPEEDVYNHYLIEPNCDSKLALWADIATTEVFVRDTFVPQWWAALNASTFVRGGSTAWQPESHRAAGMGSNVLEAQSEYVRMVMTDVKDFLP